eukprot:m.95537 g.95537  ORF g.95537 m.95537 type:complete len:590 (+) comp16602_c0_seq3:111-1880(+)
MQLLRGMCATVSTRNAVRPKTNTVLFSAAMTIASLSAGFAQSTITPCAGRYPCLNSDKVNGTGFRAPAAVLTCDTSGDTDYFPDKVTTDYSLLWNISYHGWYKILYNTKAAEGFVLYQRGCPQPTIDAVAEYTTVEVPVNSVEITSSVYETFFAIIGERLSIVVSSATGGIFSADPCMQAQFLSGHTSDQSCAGTCYSGTCVKAPEVAFVSKWSSANCYAQTVANATVDEVSETQLLPQVEWIEWFAVWFNKEGFVKTYVADLEAQLDCLTDWIVEQRNVLDVPAPKVLWATPPANLPLFPNSTWGSLGQCPNYYCEAIERAGGIVLNNNSAVAALAPSWPNPGPNSSTLFQTVAGEADVILVPGPLWSGGYLSASECDAVYSSSEVFPAQVPAVASQRIWDTGRIRDPLGGLDWFTSRLATPDVLVESIAQILYPNMNIRSQGIGNAWWQNVYTEAACVPADGIPNALDLVVACTNVSQPLVPERGFTCRNNVTTNATNTTTAVSSSSPEASNSDGLSTLNIVLIVICSVFLALVVIVAVQYVKTYKQVADLKSDQIPVMNAVYEADDNDRSHGNKNSAGGTSHVHVM